MTKPKTKFIPKTGLLIPDTHIQTGDDLGRFYALKAWIASRNIELDFIVQIGDLLDFEALCTHDQDAPEWYERNLMSEIEVGMKALDIIERIGRTYGKKDCPIHIIEGNHENRYNKWMAGDNRLRTSPFPQTVAKLINFYRPSNKFNYVPFLQPLIVDDIAFSHYVVSGLMARAVSGERPAGTILKSQFMSTVVGHSHTLDLAERTRTDGRKIHSLVSGCFVDPRAPFKFAGPAKKLWWNGCHLLWINAPGEFDVESISLQRMQQ